MIRINFERKIMNTAIVKRFAFIILTLSFGIVRPVSGQTDSTVPVYDRPQRPAVSQSPKPEDVILPSRGTPLVEYIENNLLLAPKSRLLPDRKYLKQFSEFLRDKNTGLVRIFPDMGCDKGNVVTIGELERCAGAVQIPGGGSYYSFRNKTHIISRKDGLISILSDSPLTADEIAVLPIDLTRIGDISPDIHFIDNTLSTVGIINGFGLISNIGDISLEGLTMKSEPVTFLNYYEPKNKSAEIRTETETFKKGVAFGNYTYSLSAPLKLNEAYILRSIAYKYKNSSYFDKRSDVIVAFKAIAKEPDDSLILLWRKLQNKSAPVLKEK